MLGIPLRAPKVSILAREGDKIDIVIGCILSIVRSNECESEMFDTEVIISCDLAVGDRLRIGWLPNRICEVRYLGNNSFVAAQNKMIQLDGGRCKLVL